MSFRRETTGTTLSLGARRRQRPRAPLIVADRLGGGERLAQQLLGSWGASAANALARASSLLMFWAALSASPHTRARSSSGSSAPTPPTPSRARPRC